MCVCVKSCADFHDCRGYGYDEDALGETSLLQRTCHETHYLRLLQSKRVLPAPQFDLGALYFSTVKLTFHETSHEAPNDRIEAGHRASRCDSVTGRRSVSFIDSSPVPAPSDDPQQIDFTLAMGSWRFSSKQLPIKPTRSTDGSLIWEMGETCSMLDSLQYFSTHNLVCVYTQNLKMAAKDITGSSARALSILKGESSIASALQCRGYSSGMGTSSLDAQISAVRTLGPADVGIALDMYRDSDELTAALKPYATLLLSVRVVPLIADGETVNVSSTSEDSVSSSLLTSPVSPPRQGYSSLGRLFPAVGDGLTMGSRRSSKRSSISSTASENESSKQKKQRPRNSLALVYDIVPFPEDPPTLSPEMFEDLDEPIVTRARNPLSGPLRGDHILESAHPTNMSREEAQRVVTTALKDPAVLVGHQIELFAPEIQSLSAMVAERAKRRSLLAKRETSDPVDGENCPKQANVAEVSSPKAQNSQNSMSMVALMSRLSTKFPSEMSKEKAKGVSFQIEKTLEIGTDSDDEFPRLDGVSAYSRGIFVIVGVRKFRFSSIRYCLQNKSGKEKWSVLQRGDGSLGKPFILNRKVISL